MTTPAPPTDGSAGSAVTSISPGHRRRRRLTRPDLWAVLPGVAVAGWLGVRALSRPHALRGVHGLGGAGYDDGVYLGAATRLIHGTWLYRDQDLLHPPGIAWLMSPVALIGELTDSQAALALARVLTLIVTLGVVALAGWAVRSRGPLSVLAASLALACFPNTVSATHTLLLEPYLLLFCLAGLNLLFAGGAIAGDRRVLGAGLCLGFACAIKIWAVVPALVLLVALVPAWRATARYAVGVAAGALGPCLPFLIMAPGRFLHDVVVAQWSRDLPGGRTPLSDRMITIAGFDAFPNEAAAGHAGAWVLALAIVLTVGVVAACALRTVNRLHTAAFACVVLVFAELLLPAQCFDHYAWFLAGFVAVAFGLTVGALPLRWRGGTTARVLGGALAVSLLVGAGALLPALRDRVDLYLSFSANPGPTIRSIVPVGACVATDQPTLLAIAARLPKDRDCHQPLDPFGLWLTDNDGRGVTVPGPVRPEFVARWRTWLREADYVVLMVAYSNYIPWTSDLAAEFRASYTQVYEAPGLVIYRHIRPAG